MEFLKVTEAKLDPLDIMHKFLLNLDVGYDCGRYSSIAIIFKKKLATDI